MNKAPFHHAELVQIFGENACQALAPSLRIDGVSTDTRTLEAGNIFVALRGERFDGHSMVREALEKGAGAAIVESSSATDITDKSAPLLTVANSLSALGALAHFHRRRFDIPIVAVAGSAGKTTTKEMTARLLEEHFTVLKTEGNFNNQIGVPLTLLRLSATQTAAVIEIGTNEPGEIEILAEMVAPTHGIITNIGKEHLEKLIDENGVEYEETALFRYLSDHSGTAFVNMNDLRLRKYYRSGWVGYGLAENSITADITGTFTLKPTTHGIVKITNRTTAQTLEAHLQSVGITGVRNAIAAAAVGFGLELTADKIQRGLEGFQPEASDAGYGRMVAGEFDLPGNRTITLLNDCYNANPTSMYAALETLQSTHAARHIALLGDMRELGAVSFDEHLALLNTLGHSSWLDMVILTGTEMHLAFTQWTKEQGSKEQGSREKICFCDTHAKAATMLLARLETADVLLVKGSRGVRLEQVLTLLESQ